MGRRSRLLKAALALSIAVIIPLGMMGCRRPSTTEHPSHEHPAPEHPTTPEHPE